ncbi:beta/gamma crystallin-related protein [Ramlibacter sp. AN1133]|uniref:beta/gamma crystallin-related protein n=1 Tax=Ramlibacter sp. AN1133 TaxID=3133429 RepID=UPI0030C514F2
MNTIVSVLFATTALACAAQASAQVTFYEQEGFQGRTLTTQKRVGNLERSGFSNRASSAVVVGQRWQVCDDVRFDGRCTVLRPGQYPSLQAMGMDNRITSVRPLPANERVADADYAPMPVVAQDFRRRRNERLFDAEVMSSRAVVGTPGQRCWIEREQVSQQPQGNMNSQEAAISAVIGGILGHQSGATQARVAQDVRRCDSNPVQATPSYWDVTYEFRGQQHRVQMATAPGRTIVVNRNGEPRG